MDKSDIHITDFKRILIGDAPWEFMAEIFFRTVIIYFFLLLIVKWLGKRMSGQLSITELGIVIMLGAIVSPPMETPERGILQGILILFLVLFYHQSVILWTFKNPKIEIIWDTAVTEILGDDKGNVNAIKLQNLKTKAASTLNVAGLFIAGYAGWLPRLNLC